MSHVSAQFSASGIKGKRILVTRPAEPTDSRFADASPTSDELTRQLTGWGAQVLHLPLVAIHHVPFCLPPETRYDWLFFTSKNAVRSFYEQGNPLPVDSVKIAVVGPATAQCVRELGYPVDFVSPEYHAESAATAFGQTVSCAGLSVLWPCGNLANPALQTILQEAGAKVHPLVVYEARPKAELSPEECALLSPHPDMLVFTSPSAVETWCALRDNNISLPQVSVACLGPKTSQSALKYLGRVDVQANPHTLPALAQAIFNHFQEGTPP